MPRRLLIVAATIVGAHLAQALLLGPTPAGNLLANLLEVSASVLAAVMCFGAGRRAKGMAHPFWTLVGCGMAIWGVANLGWMYYELVLHAEPFPGSAVRFLFNVQGIFFAMVLFLDQDKDSSEFEPEILLDFTQIAIVFFFLYLGLYYLSSQDIQQQNVTERRLWVEFGEVGTILALACFQSHSRTDETYPPALFRLCGLPLLVHCGHGRGRIWSGRSRGTDRNTLRFVLDDPVSLGRFLGRALAAFNRAASGGRRTKEDF